MTKEQEKAIERLNRVKTIKVLYTRTFAMTTEQLKVIQADIETALNMLKERDREIENNKKKNKELSNQILKLYKEQDNYNARIEKKNAELKKKDRQINLMAKYLAINGVERDICNEKRIKENCKNVTVDNITVHRCKKCIKQYFERKSENGN